MNGVPVTPSSHCVCALVWLERQWWARLISEVKAQIGSSFLFQLGASPRFRPVSAVKKPRLRHLLRAQRRLSITPREAACACVIPRTGWARDERDSGGAERERTPPTFLARHSQVKSIQPWRRKNTPKHNFQPLHRLGWGEGGGEREGGGGRNRPTWSLGHPWLLTPSTEPLIEKVTVRGIGNHPELASGVPSLISPIWKGKAA